MGDAIINLRRHATCRLQQEPAEIRVSRLRWLYPQIRRHPHSAEACRKGPFEPRAVAQGREY